MVSPAITIIQGHEGSSYYYLDAMRKYVNELIYIPLLLMLYYTTKRPSFERLYLLIWIGVPLVLLSAFSTKREVYLMFSATPFMILLSVFVYVLWKKSMHHTSKICLRIVVALVFIAAIRFSIERIKPLATRCAKPEYRWLTEDFLSKKDYGDLNSCVFICGDKYLDIRFYYNMKSYRYLDEKQILEIKSKGYDVYHLDNFNFVKK